MHRTVAIAVLVLALAAASGCGPEQDVDEPAKLSESTELDETKAQAREATAGVFTTSESDCVIDRLFARSDLSAGQIVEYQQGPAPGPVNDAYQVIVPQCVDPSAVVEPKPLSPPLREGFINGFKAGAPNVTEQQAGCVLDDAREGRHISGSDSVSV